MKEKTSKPNLNKVEEAIKQLREKRGPIFDKWRKGLIDYAEEGYKNDRENFILVSNYVDDPYRGAAIYCEGNYCREIIEKPPKGTSNSNLNNTGIFILSNEIFEMLKSQKPSKRGEIEVPVAVRLGIKERNWKFRVIKIGKTQFMGDFGNIDDYNRYKNEEAWLKLLNWSYWFQIRNLLYTP